jgi:DNA repair exonuclease SbcCD ATPase subunit
MVYKESLDLESINLKLNVLSERISLLENFKKQILSTLNKMAQNIIELKQKREFYEQLNVEIEKLKGKLEVVNEFKNQLAETTRTFSEEIGELRSMILDREKSFSKIELGFEKINEIVKEIEPKAISRELEKKEAKILELTSKIDKLEELYNELTKRTEEVRRFLEKIKSFENLVDLAKKVKKTLAEIEESKNYVDRLAGKIEAIFDDINEKVLDLDERLRKIGNVDELLRELVPTVDKLQIALENKADRKDIESIKNIGVTGVLRDKIESMEREIGEVKKLKEYLSEIKEIKDKIELLTPEEKRRRDEIKAEINAIETEISKIEEAFENKEISDEDFRRYMEEKKRKIEELTLELRKYEGKTIFGKIKELEIEIENLRNKLKEENIENLMNQIKELNNQIKILEEFREKIELMKPKTLNELISEKERISEELRLLTDQYKKGMLDRKTFEELFDRKQKNLIQITSLIREKEKHGQVIEEIRKVHTSLSDITNLISTVKENSKNIENLKKELETIKTKSVTTEEESLIKIKEVLDSLKIYEIPKNLQEIKNSLANLSSYVEHELKFMQLTSTLQYIEEESEILSYIYKIKSLVSEIKSLGRWDEEKEEYLKGLYNYLTRKYKDNKEIRDLYLSLI